MNDAEASARTSTRFSIIIPHRSGREMLERNLRHLRTDARGPTDEIFVVDNHSTDGSAEMVRDAFPEVELIRNPCNRGFAAACNQAISRASGDFLLLLNDDASVANGALDRLAEVFRQDPRAAVVGAQLVDPDGTPERSVRSIPSFRDEIGGRLLRTARTRDRERPGDAPYEVEAVPGACMAVRRSAVEAAGTLDESYFFYFEDLEWCRRFRSLGWRVYLQPAARVIHRPTTSRSTSRAAQLEMLRARLVFYRRTYPRLLSMLLELVRIARTAVNTGAQLIATAMTLGKRARHRRKLKDDAVLLAWWLAGKPDSWGLPDRCTCVDPRSCPRRPAGVPQALGGAPSAADGRERA